MIEINLLPEELRLKGKGEFSLEAKHFLYFVTLIFILLICVHIYLVVVNITKSVQLNALNNKWQSFASQRKILENFRKEYEGLSDDAKTIQRMVEQRINWAENLNRLSLNLPSGIWFNELLVSEKGLELKGSVVSKQKEELSLINKFIDNLKKDKNFFKNFNNLELESVQRRTVSGYEIVDFILVGKLKSR